MVELLISSAAEHDYAEARVAKRQNALPFAYKLNSMPHRN
jgi:hypothetical protein